MLRLIVLSLCLCPLLVHAETIRIALPTQPDFRAASEDLAGAFSYKPLDPAEPMGLLGFYAGGFLSYTPIEKKAAWRRLTGQNFDQLGMAAIGAGKGLIAGLDVAAFYAEVPDTNASLYGAAASYALAEGSLISPAISLRASATQIRGIDDFDFQTRALDLSISKGLLLITPYLGIGRVWADSDPKRQFGLRRESFNVSKLYGGIQIALTPLQLAVEADRTGDNSSYSLRLGLGF